MGLIDVTADVKAATRHLDRIAREQIPFATSVTTRFAEAEGFKPPKPFSLPL